MANERTPAGEGAEERERVVPRDDTWVIVRHEFEDAVQDAMGADVPNCFVAVLRSAIQKEIAAALLRGALPAAGEHVVGLVNGWARPHHAMEVGAREAWVVEADEAFRTRDARPVQLVFLAAPSGETP